jgi:hypothetical protein
MIRGLGAGEMRGMMDLWERVRERPCNEIFWHLLERMYEDPRDWEGYMWDWGQSRRRAGRRTRDANQRPEQLCMFCELDQHPNLKMSWISNSDSNLSRKCHVRLLLRQQDAGPESGWP